MIYGSGGEIRKLKGASKKPHLVLVLYQDMTQASKKSLRQFSETVF